MPAEGTWGDGEMSAFLAVAREAAEKTLGERPFDVQLQAAAALLLAGAALLVVFCFGHARRRGADPGLARAWGECRPRPARQEA